MNRQGLWIVTCLEYSPYSTKMIPLSRFAEFTNELHPKAWKFLQNYFCMFSYYDNCGRLVFTSIFNRSLVTLETAKMFHDSYYNEEMKYVFSMMTKNVDAAWFHLSMAIVQRVICNCFYELANAFGEVPTLQKKLDGHEEFVDFLLEEELYPLNEYLEDHKVSQTLINMYNKHLRKPKRSP